MKVASQYIASIDDMKAEHEKQISALMDKLKAADLQNKLPASDNTTSMMEKIDVSGDEDPTSSEINQQETIEIDSNDDDDNMSGLSIDSSDDDNEPIMNTIKRNRREQAKNKLPSEASNPHPNSPLCKSYRVSSVTPGKGELQDTPPPSANDGRRSTL